MHVYCVELKRHPKNEGKVEEEIYIYVFKGISTSKLKEKEENVKLN